MSTNPNAEEIKFDRRRPVPMQRNLQVNMNTGRSRVASGTICRKKAPQAFAKAVIDVDNF